MWACTVSTVKNNFECLEISSDQCTQLNETLYISYM